MKKITTLCIIHEPEKSRVLLGMKKRGFGKGRWNGFGGKLMPGESIEQAMIREMKEEAGIDVVSSEKMGILEFEFKGDPQLLEVHVFKVTGYKGEPTETEEMKPQWFDENRIPFNEMWPDDMHWMPLFLKGEKFKAKFLFGSDAETVNGQNQILNYKLESVTL